MRVDAEDVDELQVGEDVGGGEEALGDQHRVPRVPLVPAIQSGTFIPFMSGGGLSGEW